MRLPILTIIIGLFLLTGCGKKGPLYLPEDDQNKANQAQSFHPAASNSPANFGLIS